MMYTTEVIVNLKNTAGHGRLVNTLVALYEEAAEDVTDTEDRFDFKLEIVGHAVPARDVHGKNGHPRLVCKLWCTGSGKALQAVIDCITALEKQKGEDFEDD